MNPIRTSLALSFFLLSLVTGCHLRERTAERPGDVVMLGYDVLNVILDPDNWYFCPEPRGNVFPDVYELFSMGLLSDSFYSSEYWIDIGRWQLEPPLCYSGEAVPIYFVFMLPKEQTESFYLVTDAFDRYSTECRFQLRRYDAGNLLRVREALEANTDCGDVECEILAAYLPVFVPEFTIRIQRDVRERAMEGNAGSAQGTS
jgi:hypothetical protein